MAKSYLITVNGKTYDVVVEEKGEVDGVAPASMHSAASAAAPAAAEASENAINIEAGAAGKVFRVESPIGTQVKKGQTIVVLEVMKMETPVVAPEDGKVISVAVSEGQQVEAGELLATMEPA